MIAAMKQALESLRNSGAGEHYRYVEIAIATLRAAITKAQKIKPVACVDTRTEFSNYTTIQTDDLYISNYEPLGENGLVLGAQLYLAPQPAIPAGWQLVPVEPTPEMISAADRHEHRHSDIIYRSMLDAAPKPENSHE